MVVTICIGSSCHIKGSHDVVKKLQSLVDEHGLQDRVTLAGAFCMGQCQKGVCVKIDDKIHSVTMENVNEFFKENILGQF